MPNKTPAITTLYCYLRRALGLGHAWRSARQAEAQKHGHVKVCRHCGKQHPIKARAPRIAA